MEYHALLVGIDYALFEYLAVELPSAAIDTTYALTAADGIRQFVGSHYDLVLVSVQMARQTSHADLMGALRRAKSTPIFVLTAEDDPQDAARIIDYGADMCLPENTAPLLIAKHAYALVRRFTGYNRYDTPEALEAAPFGCGDIFIDPLRRTVQVREQPVRLNPREFALLLYLMRNPCIVLSASQICEQAWRNESGYNQDVSGPVAILRKAIEQDSSSPIYIETVRGVGYRFTGYKSETCDG